MDSGTNMDSDHGSTVDHGTEEPDSSSVEIIREEELQQGNTPKPSIRYKRARRIRYKTRAQRRSVVIIHEEEEEELQQGHNFMSRERAEEIIREEGLKLRMLQHCIAFVKDADSGPCNMRVYNTFIWLIKTLTFNVEMRCMYMNDCMHSTLMHE